MAFIVHADCTFLGVSTYPRANNQVGTQVHLLNGLDSVKVSCEPSLVSKVPVAGTRCDVTLDFMATRNGNFLKALDIVAIPVTAAK